MITVVVIFAAFVAAAITVIVALLRLGIAREETGHHSLYSEPPTVAAAISHRLLDWHGPVPSDAVKSNYAANLASTPPR